MLTSRFEQALSYAAVVHAGHMRKKTTIPYISHLLIVAGTVLDYFGDEDEAISALLHDAVEDVGGEWRLADIRQRFGDRVANIVASCSNAVTDADKDRPAAERRLKYLEHLRHEENASVLLVASCDKLANARSILKDHRSVGDQVFDRFSVGKVGTMDYYRELVEVLTERGPKPVVEEFARVVSKLIARAGGEALA